MVQLCVGQVLFARMLRFPSKHTKHDQIVFNCTERLVLSACNLHFVETNVLLSAFVIKSRRTFVDCVEGTSYCNE